MTIKSMPVFFIDNQQMWPADAKLHGSLVLWPDKGKYPTYAGIAIADHPEFEGKIVAQAGNRGVLISLLPGAKSMDDIQTVMSAKPGPEQYRVAVDAIIHAVMLAREDVESAGDCHPFALLTMLAKSSPIEARVIAAALRAWIKSPTTDDAGRRIETPPTAVQKAEEMMESLDAALAEPRPE